MNTFLKILFLLFLFPFVCISGDLNDGISTYTEDSISKYDQVFKKDINIAYIKTVATAKKNKRVQNKDYGKSAEKVDKDGISRDKKGNMRITRDSKIKPGQTIVNNPKGGKDMEGNMIIDKDARIPIGSRLINAPKFKK